MRPSDHKSTQSILIVDVHAVFLHTCLIVSVGCDPGAQLFTGLWISYRYGIQCFNSTKIGYGHLVQQLIWGSGAGQLMYMTGKLIINIHTVIIEFLGYLVVQAHQTHESAHVYFCDTLIIQHQH